MLVDENWAAAGWQAEYKRSFSCGIEGLDAVYAWTLVTCLMRKGAAGACTNEVIRNVLGRSSGIVSNNQPPRRGKRAVEHGRTLA